MTQIAFRQFGGKARLAEWICSLLPPHRCYVEPFCGSAAVLLNKQPSKIEIINDLDDEIINFFTVVREQPDELARLITLTPFSRHEFEKPRIRTKTPPPLERARQFLAQRHMQFGSNHGSFKFGIDQDYVAVWNNLPPKIAKVAHRLKNCLIEKKDALTLITSYDKKNVILYLDPPYLLSTRSSTHRYKHDLNTEYHIQLIDILNNLKHAKYALSGYPSDLYENTLNYTAKFSNTARTHFNTTRLEHLWTNYQPENFLL